MSHKGDDSYFSDESRPKEPSRNNVRRTSIIFAAIALSGVLIFASLAFAFSNMLFLPEYSQAYAASSSVNVVTGKSVALGSQVPPGLGASALNSGPPPSITNFNISAGYNIEPVLWNMSFPSAVTFDDKHNMFVAEAGAGFGGVRDIARILKIDENGTVSVLTDRGLSAPITDMIYSDGRLFVSNKAKISTVNLENGLVTDIVTELPSGDHVPDQMAIGPDGRLYFAIGSATNSGVVGTDNYLPSLGWLASYPMAHDVPAKNITLTGQNFETTNVLADGAKKINSTLDMNKVTITNEVNASAKYSSGKGTGDIAGNVTGNATTGAFVPFGNTTYAGQTIQGKIHCDACIMSTRPDGGEPKVVAWGMRLDIFSGLAFDKNGKLIIADSGSEERGSRPIRNDHDKIWKIDVSNSTSGNTTLGQWYGWPDFFFSGANGSKSLQPVTDAIFKSPRAGGPLQFLIKNHPPASALPKVFADPGYAVKMTKAVLINSTNFGFAGKMLVGEYGTHAPSTHDFSGTKIKEYIPGNNGTQIIGQKVVLFDSEKGNFTDFLSLKKPDPSFRPVDVSFSPDGNALYVTSFGKSDHRITLPNGAALPMPQIWSYRDSGVIWRITKTPGAQASEMPPKKLTLSPDLMVTANSGPAPKSDMVNVPAGYKIEPVFWNLNIPGSETFDDKGNMYIAEVGFAYVGLFPPPMILKVDHQGGNVSVFVDRGLDYPLTYITFHDGKIYASNGGRIAAIDMQGRVQTIIAALPGVGDHYVDQIAFGKDGRMYFGVGTATNSGVVSNDNPWVKALPDFRDIPGKNITMTGVNHATENFFQTEKKGIVPRNVTTGAYSPFGTPNYKGQVIKGDIKCTGCLLSANPDGTDVKLVGWGLRHPYGEAFEPDGKKLFVTMNAADERGARNIGNDGDKMYVVDTTNSSEFGQWYGWPDFFSFQGGSMEPVTNEKFQSIRNENPLQPVIQNHLPVKNPVLTVETGAALTHAVFSNSSQFGFKGKALVAEFGTLAPQTHLNAVPESVLPGSVMGQTIGQKVIVVDPNAGNYQPFITLKTADSTFRPTGLVFSPDGNSLYITSVAKNEVRSTTPQGGVLPQPYGIPWAYPMTGVIWKVTHANASSLGSANNTNSSITNSANSNATMVNNKNAETNKPTVQPKTFPVDAQVNIILGAALARDKAFDPNPVDVEVNGTVHWTNKDSVVHTVTSGEGFSDPNMGKEFDSGLLGGTFSHRFNATGTFDYFCQIHPTMRGQVVAQETIPHLPSAPGGGIGGE